MKKIIYSLLMVMTFIMFEPKTAEARITNSYYGAGNYVTSANIKPTGLKFYVDYSAISAYGSSPFTAAFDWNGNYSANVAAIAQYPASASAYSTYFLIEADTTMLDYVRGETFYFDSSGNCINDKVTYPMDYSIYKCKIAINGNKTAFNVDGSFSNGYLKKVITHEVGHVFLLKHPSNKYFSSIMHEGAPNAQVSSTVTTDDRNNLIAKWK